MATVESKFIGFDPSDEFAKWIDRLSQRSEMKKVLDALGKGGVTESVKFIMQKKVEPPLKDSTVERRRKKSNVPLFDTGVGARQIAHDVSVVDLNTRVGVPDGYMAYHQEGRVPNAPKREFLQLPDDDMIEKTIMFYLEK